MERIQLVRDFFHPELSDDRTMGPVTEGAIELVLRRCPEAVAAPMLHGAADRSLAPPTGRMRLKSCRRGLMPINSKDTNVDRLTLEDSDNIITLSSFDSLVGGSGSDIVTVTGAISGATVNLGGDQIGGGLGADALADITGIDRFTCSAVTGSTSASADTITDFDPAASLLVFTGLLTGAFAFPGSDVMTATGSIQSGSSPSLWAGTARPT